MFVITDNFGFFNKELDHLISCTHRREYLSDFKTALVLTYTLACHYCPVHSQNRNLIREQNWHYYIVVGPKIFLDGGWSQKGCVRTSWQARGYVRSGLGAEGVVMAGCRDRLAVAAVSMMGHRCCPTQPVLDSITSTTSTQHIPCMIGSISDFVSNANKHNTSSFPLFCTHSWCW